MNVLHIQAAQNAFAAIADGSVVTRGKGGDSSSVQHQLKKVQQIYSSKLLSHSQLFWLMNHLPLRVVKSVEVTAARSKDFLNCDADGAAHQRNG